MEFEELLLVRRKTSAVSIVALTLFNFHIQHFFGKCYLENEQSTRRERPKSAPYLRLKNIQGTTIGNIWKKKYFFSKKVFGKKVAQCRKT